MAYTEEKFFERGTFYSKTWRISVLQDGGPAAGDRITASDSFFKIRYPFTEDRDFWNQKIIEPVLECTILFERSVDLSFYRNIVESPDDTYRLQFQYDGNVVSFGSISGDKVTISERPGQSKVTLRGKPLELLRGTLYPLKSTDSFVEIAPLIGDLINLTGTDLDIFTYGEWQSPVGGGNDYFEDAALNTYHLRNYAGSRDQDTQKTYYEALKGAIPPGHVFTLRENGWHLLSLPYIAKNSGSSLNRYRYTFGGTVYSLASSSTVSLVESLGTNRDEVILKPTESSSKHFAGYKRIRDNFNHQTLITNFDFDESYQFVGVGQSPETIVNTISSDGQQHVILEGTVTVDTDDTGGNFKTGKARLLLQAGDREYDVTGDSWDLSGGEIELGLSGSTEVLTNTFSITTDQAIPSSVGEDDLTLELRYADDEGSAFSWTADSVTWELTKYQLVNDLVAATGSSIEFIYEQTDQYTEELTLPTRIFGDGPTEYSKSAISYLSTNYIPVTNFTRKSGGSFDDYSELVMSDIMNAQRSGVRVLKASITGDLNIFDVIQWDGDYYILLGGDFIGYDSQWSATLYQLKYATGTDSFSQIEDVGGSAPSGSFSNNNDTSSTAKNDARYLNESANLSDLDNPVTAQTNLKLKDQTADLDLNSLAINGNDVLDDSDIGVSVQAWDAELDTLSGMTSSQATGLVGVSGQADFNDVVIAGDLTVQGSTTSVNTTNMDVDDALVKFADGNGTNTLDIGFIGQRASNNAGFIWDESEDEFATILTADDATTSGNVPIDSYADFHAGSIIAESSDGSQLVNILRTGTATDDNLLGTLRYRHDGVGTFAEIRGVSSDVAGGTLDGKLSLYTQRANALSESFYIESGDAFFKYDVTVDDGRFFIRDRTGAGTAAIDIGGSVSSSYTSSILATDSGLELDTTAASRHIIHNKITDFNDDILNPSFVDGWLVDGGSGWQITNTGEATFEDLLVRGRLKVFEFIVKQIATLGGSEILSIAVAEADSVSGTAGSETVTITDPRGFGGTSLAVNDLCLVQRVDVNDTTIVKQEFRTVSSITGTDVTFTSTTGAPAPSDAIEVGDIIVAYGNTTDATRQNIIYRNVDASSQSIIDRIQVGIDSYSDFSSPQDTTVVARGDLNGTVAGISATEYGIAAGDMSLTSNYFLFTENQADINVDTFHLATTSGNLVLNSAQEIFDIGNGTHFFDGLNNSVSFSNGILSATNTDINAGNFTIDNGNGGQIYSTPGDSRLFLQSNRSAKTAGSFPSILTYHNTKPIAAFMGLIRDSEGDTDEFGFSLNPGVTADPYFQFTKNLNDDTFTSFIGGINFDNTKLWTGDATNGYVGMGKTGASTDPAFWAGADNKDGSGGTASNAFLVRQDGQIFSQQLRRNIWAPSISAAFDNSISSAGSLTNIQGHSETTGSVQGTSNDNFDSIKGGTPYTRQFGEQKFVLECEAREELSADINGAGNAQYRISVYIDDGATVTEIAFDNTSLSVPQGGSDSTSYRSITLKGDITGAVSIGQKVTAYINVKITMDGNGQASSPNGLDARHLIKNASLDVVNN